MKHIYCPKGKLVYEEGSFGHEFYIILMGKASVYISEIENKSTSAPSWLKKYKPLNNPAFERANEVLTKKYEFTKLKPGDSFGENALLYDRPLSESILWVSDCHFAVLSKNKFEQILKRIEMKTKSGWKNFFRNHPIFENLTLVSLEKLFQLVELKMYQRGQVIFKEQDEVKGFYLVYEGEVGISKVVTGKVHEKLDINKFIKQKNEMEGKVPA